MQRTDDLAAAVERLLRIKAGELLRDVYPRAWESHQPDCVRKALYDDQRTLADAYLARESDDAKPVTREWLDDRLGGRIENAYLRPHGDGQGRCDAIQEIGGEWWAYLACMESAGSAAARRLDTRGDVRAFLRLARWPIKETNGGE